MKQCIFKSFVFIFCFYAIMLKYCVLFARNDNKDYILLCIIGVNRTAQVEEDLKGIK